ncbi:hypothetical protein [Telluribacter sp.]|jgi:hypothetical protein|uniref:hypothetical protein n=1 Tax=Telluribacter sp. TaxID=1978767 RepID=UPI0039C9B51D
MPFNEVSAFYTNIVTSIFLLFYILFYTYFLKNKGKNQHNKELTILQFYKSPNLSTLSILFTVSLFSTFIATSEIIEKISFLNIIISQESEETSILLLKKKVLYNFPFATLLYLVAMRRNFAPNIFIVTLLLILMILITKNPLLEKRNGLGPTYLLLLYLLFHKYLISNQILLSVFLLLFIIFFPISSIFTHSSIYGWGNILSYRTIDIIISHFSQLHFDAWSNLTATLEYVHQYNFTFGNQLLGTFLFFFPRSMWPNKPIPSGVEIGNYLINNHGMWFNNLSNPIVAEAYIDFGIPGIILYSIILSYVVFKLGTYIIQKNNLIIRNAAIYTSISLIFILRGSLMPAFAYICGSLFTIVLIPILITNLTSKITAKAFIFKK